MFFRICDESRPEQAEDHVTDWTVIIDEYAKAMGGGKVSGALKLEGQVYSFRLRIARIAELQRAAEAGSKVAPELLKSETPMPALEARLAVLEGKLKDATKGKPPTKYEDFIMVLTKLSNYHKYHINPKEISTLEYCLLCKDAAKQ